MNQDVAETRLTPRAAIIADVVQQHADEAVGLWTSRVRLTEAPSVSLFDLRRSDERIAAHLDGLAVAGDDGSRICDAMLENPTPGVVFVAAVRALEERQRERLDRLLALTAADQNLRGGLVSAFGWLERQHLQGIVAELLKSSEPTWRMVGIAACRVHRVDPGLATGRWLEDQDPLVRACALRAAGEVGCGQLKEACVAATFDEDAGCQFRAGWSGVLLGDRGVALNAIARSGLAPGPQRSHALGLALQAMSVGAAHAALRQLAEDPAQLRTLIKGSGIAGDPSYIPWLMGHMAKNEAARLAAEAFTLITGADLDTLQLARARPEDAEAGPTESPDDENVEMDPDEGLPWPDVNRVRQWWVANAERFHDTTRVFMGAPVEYAHCLEVLKKGRQRQRILAAYHICLLMPGTPLFNTSAPAWRQQKLLTQMG